MLTVAERRQIVVDWNATLRAYHQQVCLHALVAAQAARTSEAVAVVFGDRRLT